MRLEAAEPVRREQLANRPSVAPERIPGIRDSIAGEHPGAVATVRAVGHDPHGGGDYPALESLRRSRGTA